MTVANHLFNRDCQSIDTDTVDATFKSWLFNVALHVFCVWLV